MDYSPKTYTRLIGTPGFSDALLQDHFKLYEGYVVNTNKSAARLAELSQTDKSNTPEFAEIRRRFGWEFNGMRLHELYFENMGHANSASVAGGSGNANAPMRIGEPLSDAMKKWWGSADTWLKDFKATGTMRGIGWTILYHDRQSKRLFNVWVNEHDMGHLAGCEPLLVLDVFEHAYVRDYGLKRADYIDAFLAAVDWSTVSARLSPSP